MPNNMSYQRAQSLQGVGIGSLIRRNLASGDNIGESIRGAISDRFTSQVTRFKEKFDPLRIGRALGGNFGVSALGKITGRSDEDISHFSKSRVRASEVKKSMNPLITKVSEGSTAKMKKGDGLADVMSKIYNLVKQNMDERRLQAEETKNLSIDKEKERDKWHKELIEAITGFKSPTVTKQEETSGGESFFSKIFKFVDGLFGGKLNKVLEFFKGDMFKGLVEFITGPLFRTLIASGEWLVALLASPEALALGIGALLLASSFFVGKLLKNKIEESQEEKAMREGGPEAVKALKKIQDSQDALNESGTESEEQQAAKAEYDAAVKKKQDLIGTWMLQRGYDRYAELNAFGKPTGKFIFRDKNKKLAPDSLLQEANDAISAQQSATATPKSASPGASATPAESSTSSSSGAPTGSTGATATPVASTPSAPATAMQSATDTNNQMRMEESTSPKVVSIDNSQAINASKGAAPPGLSMDSSAPIRTDDPTLQNIQKKNLRMV